MTEILFTGQLTEEGFREVNTLAGRKIFRFWTLWIAVLVLVLAWTWGWRGLVGNPGAAAYTFGPLLLVLPFSFVLRRYMVRRHWNSNKVVQKPIKGSATDEALTWEIDGVSSNRFSWDLLLRYRDSSSLVLVYQGLNQVFYFFPHFFADREQWDEFRRLVATKLPRK